jgi:putative membrane protein
MTPSVSRLFSDQDLARIKQAVEAAETKTSGEIVPYVVEQSDDYERVVWRGASAAGGLAILIFLAIHAFTVVWLPFALPIVLAVIMAAFGAGMVLVHFVPAVKRLLAGRTLLQKRVSQRAAEAFIAEEVFDTRERTGILLFVSVLERHVLVVGDSGINARVKQEEWDDVVQSVVRGIRSGSPAAGIVEAVGKCGVLLEHHGVVRRADDKDELRDDLRMSDR